VGSVRKKSTAAGLAGLTEADRSAWGERRFTQAEIADRLGVSKQALNKEFHRRGWTLENSKSVAVLREPTSPEKSEDEAGDLSEAVGSRLLQADIWLLEITGRELHRVYKSPETTIGPSSLKAAAATLNMLRENFMASGVIRPLEDAEQLPQMVIRVLTPEEEAEIRHEVEQEKPDA
jgi:transcriptional regulator with XRE-family HTH domain